MTKVATKFKETDIGLIPEEWEVVPVGDFCSMITCGGTPSRSKKEYYQKGEIGWLKTKELNDSYIYDTEEKITVNAIENSSAKILPVNTVSMAMYGATVGKLGILATETSTNQACCNMVTREDSDFRFLFYSLLNKRGDLIGRANGAAQQNLSTGIIKNFKLAKPHLEEQKQIAEILSSLDDKIELNRKINANLEKLASALFKKWFVDIGDELPEGWKVVELKNILELNYGKALKAEDRAVGEIKVYGSSGIVGFNDKKLVDGPGIIVGRKGNVGSVFWSDDDFYAIDTTYYVKSKAPLTYCYYLIKNQTFVNGDSVVPGLNRDQAYRVEVLLPSADALEKFDTIASDLRKAITAIERESENISLMRDSLLPRLMSGKIMVNV